MVLPGPYISPDPHTVQILTTELLFSVKSKPANGLAVGLTLRLSQNPSLVIAAGLSYNAVILIPEYLAVY